MIPRSSAFEANPIRPVNLQACLSIRIERSGIDRFGLPEALQIWQTIIQDEDICGKVAIARSDGNGAEIVACGIGVFVNNDFAAGEIAAPQPDLNGRILESVARHESVLADYDTVAQDNFRGTLQQVLLYSHTKRGALSEQDEILVRSLLSRNYAENFVGYNIERMLFEAVDALDVRDLKNYPSVQCIHAYDDPAATPLHPPRAGGLYEASARTFNAEPSSAAAPVFLHKLPPRFGFTRGEKALLQGALRGLDDAALALALCRTAAAVKRRWCQIFDKVSMQDAALCPPHETPARGPQKRHLILNYLRIHPEELRPYADTAAPTERTRRGLR